MALSVYKKGQGTAARGLSSLVAVLLAIWAAHQMWFTIEEVPLVYRVPVVAIVAALFGVVPVYLMLFHHQVSDLLIETQQEMRKVAWSSRGEVLTSTAVVIVTVALMSLFIFVTDRILLSLAELFGVY